MQNANKNLRLVVNQIVTVSESVDRNEFLNFLFAFSTSSSTFLFLLTYVNKSELFKITFALSPSHFLQQPLAGPKTQVFLQVSLQIPPPIYRTPRDIFKAAIKNSALRIHLYDRVIIGNGEWWSGRE